MPYKLLAGVEPCAGGWLVAAGRLQGTTLHPIPPWVAPTFIDVLDYKPAFQVIAAHIPIGLLDEPTKGGRTCEREARKVLGPRRGTAVMPAPTRPALSAKDFATAYHKHGPISAVTWNLIPKIREVEAEIQPYWQRTVYEVNPELSYFQLNDDVPLKFGKRTLMGQDERREILTRRLGGIEKVIDAHLPRVRKSQLLDAAADLWTARRIMAKAVARLPEIPEWDSLGLRMEIVR